MEKHGNLRLAEFAKQTGYEISTVRKKISRREVDYFKVGRIILIPEREVERLLSDFRPRVEIKAGEIE